MNQRIESLLIDQKLVLSLRTVLSHVVLLPPFVIFDCTRTLISGLYLCSATFCMMMPACILLGSIERSIRYAHRIKDLVDQLRALSSSTYPVPLLESHCAFRTCSCSRLAASQLPVEMQDIRIMHPAPHVHAISRRPLVFPIGRVNRRCPFSPRAALASRWIAKVHYKPRDRLHPSILHGPATAPNGTQSRHQIGLPRISGAGEMSWCDGRVSGSRNALGQARSDRAQCRCRWQKGNRKSRAHVWQLSVAVRSSGSLNSIQLGCLNHQHHAPRNLYLSRQPLSSCRSSWRSRVLHHAVVVPSMLQSKLEQLKQVALLSSLPPTSSLPRSPNIFVSSTPCSAQRKH